MTEVLKWVGIGAAIWFAVSVIVAIGWAVVVSDIKRTPRPVREADDERALRVVR
jgi:hypothetical protein